MPPDLLEEYSHPAADRVVQEALVRGLPAVRRLVDCVIEKIHWPLPPAQQPNQVACLCLTGKAVTPFTKQCITACGTSVLHSICMAEGLHPFLQIACGCCEVADGLPEKPVHEEGCQCHVCCQCWQQMHVLPYCTLQVLQTQLITKEVHCRHTPNTCMIATRINHSATLDCWQASRTT